MHIAATVCHTLNCIVYQITAAKNRDVRSSIRTGMKFFSQYTFF